MSKISVDLGKNSYDVVIESGILNNVFSECNLNRKVMVVTDDGVPQQYVKTVLSQCKNGYSFTFKAGESSKTLQTYQDILSEMLRLDFNRKDCVVAVGGGVVGDLAGFVAASFMRGVDFYNIPTTMLSQVDSSIGGKTAVNLNDIKNVVGAFYQPKKVIIDTDVLATLPKRQIVNGMAESLKMAATFDKDFFDIFLLDNPFDKIEQIIEKSLVCKKNVVEQDEKEAGLRKVLNFGHTIGHGIEGTLLDDRTLYHGECVALGMLPMCTTEVRAKLVECYKKLTLPTCFDFDEDEVCKNISHDKKSDAKIISTVFVPEIGKYEFRDLDIEQLSDLLPLIKDKK